MSELKKLNEELARLVSESATLSQQQHEIVMKINKGMVGTPVRDLRSLSKGIIENQKEIKRISVEIRNLSKTA
jgi:hypothetical protein